jgi:hypothetical protein
MPQHHDQRGHDMPPALAHSLVNRSTWDLFCGSCARHIYPDVIGLLERFGDGFNSDLLCRRARCRDCGTRLKMCGHMFVKRLQAAGDLHRMVMPARVDRPSF